MTEDEERRLIDAVRRIAAEEIRPRFRALSDDEIDHKASRDDLVTVADTRAEIAIHDAARGVLPGVVVVGEEAVSRGDVSLDVIGQVERALIVDPIDGTWNFANGVATYGVLLALVEGSQTTWGCIYDPMGDDWVVARKGQGARFVNAVGRSREVSVAQPVAPDDAFGLVPLYLYHGEERAHLAGAVTRLRRTANLRCSAHEYRLLADGRADFVLTGLLHPWDHAAGVLIHQEAGGVAKLLDGTPYAPTLTEGRLLAASGEALWDELAERFAALA